MTVSPFCFFSLEGRGLNHNLKTKVTLHLGKFTCKGEGFGVSPFKYSIFTN